MVGAQTPICNDCGISLCWDIPDEEAKRDAAFWGKWVCQECNGGEPMSLKQWQRPQTALPLADDFGAALHVAGYIT